MQQLFAIFVQQHSRILGTSALETADSSPDTVSAYWRRNPVGSGSQSKGMIAEMQGQMKRLLL